LLVNNVNIAVEETGQIKFKLETTVDYTPL